MPRKNPSPHVGRDAQIVAMSLFANGEKSEVTFSRTFPMNPRAGAALNELTNALLISRRSQRGGSVHYQGSEWLRLLKTTWKMLDKDEDFPLNA